MPMLAFVKSLEDIENYIQSENLLNTLNSHLFSENIIDHMQMLINSCSFNSKDSTVQIQSPNGFILKIHHNINQYFELITSMKITKDVTANYILWELNPDKLKIVDVNAVNEIINTLNEEAESIETGCKEFETNARKLRKENKEKEADELLEKSDILINNKFVYAFWKGLKIENNVLAMNNCKLNYIGMDTSSDNSLLTGLLLLNIEILDAIIEKGLAIGKFIKNCGGAKVGLFGKIV